MKLVPVAAPAFALLLAGCPKDLYDTGKPPRESEAESGEAESGTEGVETSVAQGFFYNYMTAEGPVAMGLDALEYAALPAFSSICAIIGTATTGSTALPPCAQCDFAYDLIVSDSQASGPECRDLGWQDGGMDGYEAGWGFAQSYQLPYYGYGYLEVEDTVIYYFPAGYGSGWYPVTFTYNGSPFYGFSYGSSTEFEAWTALGYYLYWSP